MVRAGRSRSESRWQHGLLGAVAAVALACGGDRDEMQASGTQGVMSLGDSGGGDASDEADDDGDSAGFKKDGGADEGTGVEGGDPSGQGCTKVDFLFIIDNSGSMSDEQQNLIDSFPQFIDTIQSTLDEAQDYHLMVLDTDPWVYAGCDTPGASPLPVCGHINPDVAALCETPSFECNTGQTPEMCEAELGAGVTWPKGIASSERNCEFASGKRYMTSSEPDISSAFSCAALVGTGTTTTPERPLEAMAQAVTPSTPAFACNDGFLRDDAILVVTIITDEDDNEGDGSGGTPAGWRQALVSAKGGNADAIVVLGLFGDQDQPDGGICQDLAPPPLGNGEGAEPSPRIREFVNSFGDKGFSGSVCAPSYQEFFAQAVAIIDTTCEDFVPPG